jgi:hypothetical protein
MLLYARYVQLELCHELERALLSTRADKADLPCLDDGWLAANALVRDAQWCWASMMPLACEQGNLSKLLVSVGVSLAGVCGNSDPPDQVKGRALSMHPSTTRLDYSTIVQNLRVVAKVSTER